MMHTKTHGKQARYLTYNGDRSDFVLDGTRIYDSTIKLAKALHTLKSQNINQYDNMKLLGALVATPFEGVSGTFQYNVSTGAYLSPSSFSYDILNFGPSGFVKKGSVEGNPLVRNAASRRGVVLTDQIIFSGGESTIPKDGSCPGDCKSITGTTGGDCISASQSCSCYPSYSGISCSDQAEVNIFDGHAGKGYQIPCGTQLKFKLPAGSVETAISTTSGANILSQKSVVVIFSNDSLPVLEEIEGASAVSTLVLPTKGEDQYFSVYGSGDSCPLSFFLQATSTSDGDDDSAKKWFIAAGVVGVVLITVIIGILLYLRWKKYSLIEYQSSSKWKIPFDDVALKINNKNQLRDIGIGIK